MVSKSVRRARSPDSLGWVQAGAQEGGGKGFVRPHPRWREPAPTWPPAGPRETAALSAGRWFPRRGCQRARPPPIDQRQRVKPAMARLWVIKEGLRSVVRAPSVGRTAVGKDNYTGQMTLCATPESQPAVSPTLFPRRSPEFSPPGPPDGCRAWPGESDGRRAAGDRSRHRRRRRTFLWVALRGPTAWPLAGRQPGPRPGALALPGRHRRHGPIACPIASPCAVGRRLDRRRFLLARPTMLAILLARWWAGGPSRLSPGPSAGGGVSRGWARATPNCSARREHGWAGPPCPR